MRVKVGFLSRALVGAALVLSVDAVVSAGTITVANWNMGNAPNFSGDPNLTNIFNYMAGTGHKYDVLAMVETDTASAPIVSTDASTLFGGTYASITARADGGGDRTGFSYNTATLQLLDSTEVGVGTITHPSLRAHFRPVGTTGADDFYYYAVHLRSGDTSTIRADRLAQAQVLRTDADSLGSANVLFGGDFNWSAADEVTPGVVSPVSGAYRAFANIGPGSVHDPLNAVGTWRNNPAYLSLETNDPGQSMNDRFDMQLASDELFDGTGLDYVDGSYSVLGNNGTHLLGSPITTGTGAPAGVLASLGAFSDHLPVVAQYAFFVPEPGMGVLIALALPFMRRRRA